MRPEDVFGEIKDLMIFGSTITSISYPTSSTSRIVTPSISGLISGMLVEIGNNVYQISNLLTTDSTTYSFDVSGTLTGGTTWQLALYYEFGRALEIGNTLDDKKKDPINKNKRFPLMWLLTDIPKLNTELGYSAPITIAFIYLSQQNLKAGKRIDTNFEPILDPLVALFKETIENAPGNRYFYLSFGERIEYTDTDKFKYGSIEGDRHVFNDITDAIQLNIDLNFFNEISNCSS